MCLLCLDVHGHTGSDTRCQFFATCRLLIDLLGRLFHAEWLSGTRRTGCLVPGATGVFIKGRGTIRLLGFLALPVCQNLLCPSPLINIPRQSPSQALTHRSLPCALGALLYLALQRPCGVGSLTCTLQMRKTGLFSLSCSSEYRTVNSKHPLAHM